jgi:diaminopimelate dehydrogenase
VKEGADKARIEKEIKEMPDYFAQYNTTVHFISQQDLNEKHAGLPHGGLVIRSGVTGKEKENKHVIEYSLKLDSNPEFTSSVLVACARAAYKLNAEGNYGCKTMIDIPPVYLSGKSREELLKTLL